MTDEIKQQSVPGWPVKGIPFVMTDEIKRPGHLEYRCKSCGALVRFQHSDVRAKINNLLAFGSVTLAHECDNVRLGVLDLIGCTFSEEEPN